MRFFSFGFLFIFGLNVWAQSPVVAKHFSDGTRHANTQNFDQALKSYKTALSAADNEYLNDAYRARLHYNIGVCYFQMQEFDLASKEFKSALLLKKDYKRAHYALGMTKMRQRAWKSASASFTDLLRSDPRNAQAWFDFAVAKIALNDLDAAERAFASSIANGSIDTSLSHNNIGVILALKGDLAAAEEAFETAIAMSGGRFVDAERNLSLCRSVLTNSRKLIANELQFTARRSDFYPG